MATVRTRGGIGQHPRGFDIITSPFARAPMLSSDVVSTCLNRSDSRLDGAIILWSSWGRQQRADIPLPEEANHFVGPERAVVGLQDDGRSELSKERQEGIAGGFGGFVGGGQGEQLIAAGKIAHDQDGAVEVIDGCGRLGVVDGPDGAGSVPAELVQFKAVSFAPDAAVASEQSSQFASAHEREEQFESGAADVWPQRVEQVDDVVSVRDVRGNAGSAAWFGTKLGMDPEAMPARECSRAQLE